MKLSLLSYYILFAGSVALGQKTIYVNNLTGSDVNSGSSPDSAKRTIQSAIHAMASGDTISVAASPQVYEGMAVVSGKTLVLASDGGEPQLAGLTINQPSLEFMILLAASFKVDSVVFINGLIVTGSHALIMNQGKSFATQGFNRIQVTGSRISHVVGNVKKTLRGTRNEFPVGDSISYRPLALTLFDSTDISSQGIVLTVKHVNSWVYGVVGLPVSDLLFCPINMIAPFYWKVSSSGSLGETPFHLGLTATGFRGFSDVSNLRIIRRAGTEDDVTNAWAKQSSLYDNFSNGGDPTIVARNSIGGIEAAGVIFTIGWYHGEIISNPFPDVVLSELNPLFRRSLTNPPVFPPPCGGYKGTLTFSAVVTDSNVAKAAIASNDTLVITRVTNLGTTDCTITATDSFDGRITSRFKITNTSTVLVQEHGHSTTSTFVLGQNYPNPFNARTAIDFSIPKQCLVVLTIFNSLGMEIEVLVSQNLPPGPYRAQWTPRDIPTGVYFCQLKSTEFTDTKKLLLLR